MNNIPIPGTLVPAVVGGKVVRAADVDGTIPSATPATLLDGSTVGVSVVDTTQAIAGGRIAVDSLGGDNVHYSANSRIRVGMLLGAAAIGA